MITKILTTLISLMLVGDGRRILACKEVSRADKPHLVVARSANVTTTPSATLHYNRAFTK